MGNIVLRIFVVLVYIVICVVFCISPFMGGRDNRFGIKVDIESKLSRSFCVLYVCFSILCAIAFSIACIGKNSYIFSNISIILYIVLVSLIYYRIRNSLKAVFVKDVPVEIIINNPPGKYLLKMINPAFYITYLVPVIISFFIGKGDAWITLIISVQAFIAILSFIFNFIICKFKNFVDDNIEESIKKNLKYRKVWNVNAYFTLLLCSVSISVMHAEYKKIINVGGISEWLPLVIIVISLSVLIFYSFRIYKKWFVYWIILYLVV